MSAKEVVRADLEGEMVRVTMKSGEDRVIPLTERIAKKMEGLTRAYFHARLTPDEIKLDRYAPVSAWQE